MKPENAFALVIWIIIFSIILVHFFYPGGVTGLSMDVTGENREEYSTPENQEVETVPPYFDIDTVENVKTISENSENHFFVLEGSYEIQELPDNIILENNSVAFSAPMLENMDMDKNPYQRPHETIRSQLNYPGKWRIYQDNEILYKSENEIVDVTTSNFPQTLRWVAQPIDRSGFYLHPFGNWLLGYHQPHTRDDTVPFREGTRFEITHALQLPPEVAEKITMFGYPGADEDKPVTMSPPDIVGTGSGMRRYTTELSLFEYADGEKTILENKKTQHAFKILENNDYKHIETNRIK